MKMCAAAAELEHSRGPGGLPRSRRSGLTGRKALVGEVVLVSADEYPPYNRPPLSKDFLRGERRPRL
jgi:hypothetical protein